MRHPITDRSWHRWIGNTLAAAVLVLAVSAFAQESDPPPPPDIQQPAPPIDQTSPIGNSVRAVRLSDVEGRVQIFHGADQAFDQAQPNMPVVEGMRLVTDEGGRVEIQFEDGSVARVTPNSSVTLTQLHRNGDGSTVTVIDANAGLSYYELNGRAGQYTVRVGPNNVTPVDSSIFRINLDGNPADLAVTHGTVHISDGQNLALDVRTNHSIRFDTQNLGQYEVVQSVAADTWDQWNSDRDQALATLEENATTARAGTGNPDDPAWNDLDYYGDWYDVPGYGMAWSPSGVGANWDPYGVGSWGYYSGIGYTWISGYPWGWWPYHCGGWNWFNNFGWMWFPGNCGFGPYGVGWYPYIPIWRHPPNYRPPFRPKLPPIHSQPPRGPIQHGERLIAVNRGQEFTQQFRNIGAPKPAPRTFDYDGRSIAPAESTIHMRAGGPIGEGFTTAAVRTHPEAFDINNNVRAAVPGRTVYQPG
ncbi:MAG TPA: DUF6600 domain-containing protein, partial [Silvibacterium sp.]|nr:DUF6600 domain-containing protein [Silvibacterium sp.]